MCDGIAEYEYRFYRADCKGIVSGKSEVMHPAPVPRLFYEMMESLNRVKSAVQADDLISLPAHFDTCNQLVDKHHTSYGDDPTRRPHVYLETLLLLENYLSKKKKEKLSLKDAEAEALCSIQEKVSKYTQIFEHCIIGYRVYILFTAIQFSFNTISQRRSKHDVPTLIQAWKQCVQNMFAVLDILAQYPNIVFVSDSIKRASTSAYEGEILVRGNLVDFLLRIYFEFDMNLEFINSHNECYVERFNDEAMLFTLAQNVMAYLREKEDFTQAVKVAMLLVELVYHKTQDDYDRLRKLVNPAVDLGEDDIAVVNLAPQPSALPMTCRILMDHLVSFIYNYGYPFFQIMAMIYDIYNYAIIDNFSYAVDFMLTNCLPRKIQCRGDDCINLHFKRAKAQLGLSAFRLGHIEQAHDLLSQLHNGGKIEDQLAQGVFHIPDYNFGLAMRGNRSQIPLHMHINLELLEAVHLICSMLTEAPKSEGLFSSTAHSSVRELLIDASLALREANFQKSFGIIKSMDLWNLLQNRDTILWMLKTKMKEKAMRNYLFAYSSTAPVGLDKLTRMFELSEDRVMRILRHIIEELHASWDQRNHHLVFHNASSKRRRLMEPRGSRHQFLPDRHSRGLHEINSQKRPTESSIYGYTH